MVGGVEMSSRVESMHGKGTKAVAGGLGWPRQQLVDPLGNPTLACRQAPGNNRGARQTTKSRVSAWKTNDSKPQAIKKSTGIVVVGETTSPTGETHGVLKYTQTHPPVI